MSVPVVLGLFELLGSGRGPVKPDAPNSEKSSFVLSLHYLHCVVADLL